MSSLGISCLDVEVWDVIAELVNVCTSPSPSNPFAVDIGYFESLPATERLLASSAMLNILKSIIICGMHPYNQRG